jgi:hypothetical protein
MVSALGKEAARMQVTCNQFFGIELLSVPEITRKIVIVITFFFKKNKK